MAGQTTQSLSDDLRKLSGEISSFRSEFHGFAAKVDVHLAFIKWVGVFFSGILLAFVAGAVNVAWNASALNSEVKQQGSRVAKIEGNSEAVMEHLRSIERRLDSLATRLSPDDESKKLPKPGGVVGRTSPSKP